MTKREVNHYEYWFRGVPYGPSAGQDEFGLKFRVEANQQDLWATDFIPMMLEQGRRACEFYMMDNGVRWAYIYIERHAYDVHGSEVGDPIAVEKQRAVLGVSWEGALV